MKVTASKVIFSGMAGERNNVISFCGIMRLRDGTLLATARMGSGKDTADGNTGIWRSRDNGENWTGPTVPFATEFVGRKGCLRAGFITELPDGRVVMTLAWVDRSVEGRGLYNDKTGGLCEMFPVIAESTDKGLTWSALRKVDIRPVVLPAALTGPSLLLEDGALACQFEVQKSWDDTSAIFNISTLKLSYDMGRTWSGLVEIAGRPTEKTVCWDQRIAAMGGGRYINFFWSYDTVQNKDVEIHVSLSNDGAKTWSRPRGTGLTGQIAFPVVVSEKHIVLLYVRRDEQQCIMAMPSYDGGESWDHASAIRIYDHRAVKESENLFAAMNQWSYGHPYGIKTSEREIAVVYYAGSADLMSLRFCTINFARINTDVKKEN